MNKLYAAMSKKKKNTNETGKIIVDGKKKKDERQMS